jgi:flavin reductase (DIM6/NTAB) family NADH-FMN oxidoreductase RutF
MSASTWERSATASAADLRAVARRFPRGVSIVSAVKGDVVRAMTADSFTTVSLDPLLILVAVHRGGQMHDVLTAADGFGVTILGAHQENVTGHFADSGRSSGWTQFATVPWWPAPTSGAPLLHASPGWLDCRTYDVLPGGDHVLVLGEVMHACLGPDYAPLLRFDGAYRRIPMRLRRRTNQSRREVRSYEEDCRA